MAVHLNIVLEYPTSANIAVDGTQSLGTAAPAVHYADIDVHAGTLGYHESERTAGLLQVAAHLPDGGREE